MSIWSILFLVLAIVTAVLAFGVVESEAVFLGENAVLIAKGSFLILTTLFLVSVAYKRI